MKTQLRTSKYWIKEVISLVLWTFLMAFGTYRLWMAAQPLVAIPQRPVLTIKTAQLDAVRAKLEARVRTAVPVSARDPFVGQ